MKKTCKVDGCNDKVHAKGYCSKHYTRIKRYGDPHFSKQVRGSGSLEDRFWAHVEKCEETGCWFFRGAKSRGYGFLNNRTRGRNKIVKAHRLSYEMHVGPIPEGMAVVHKCKNRDCVNPDHLEIRTVKKCVIDGCEEKIQARGLCKKHYTRLLRHGDPEFTKVETGTPEERFWAHVKKGGANDCWLFDILDGKGYGIHSIGNKGVRAHRFAYELLVGPIPDGLVVRHRCRSKNCVNPKHLEVGTQKDNALDRLRDGTETRGEAVHNSKLTEAAVLEIKRSSLPGYRLAEKYGVTSGAIYAVLSGKNWKHVEV